MTKGEAIETMLRWLDEATVNGQDAPAVQLADLKNRAAYLLDGAVKYIAGHFKIPAEYTVVRAPVKNLLNTGFSMFSGIPPDEYTVYADGGKSFYIEICGTCTVTVTGSGGTLYTGSVSSADGFSTLKANIAGASGDRVTLTVSSDYPFVVRNAAIYPCSFSSDDTVQDYIPYVPYTLPDNFREFDTVFQTSDGHEYRRVPDYRRESIKTFLLPYDETGQFVFHYWRNPADVSATAADSTVLEVATHAAQLIPLKLAVDVCLGCEELAATGRLLDQKFQSMMINLLTESIETNVIETIYSAV